MALTEYRCTCGKISGDNEQGSYNQTHVNPKTKAVENCNTNGGSTTTPDTFDTN